jgi:SAM-dependent methyltransferase
VAAEVRHYDDAWSARFYEVQVQGHFPDVALWESLARETGGPSLELACGTGRVLLELARRGHEVAGLDLSPHMLAVAREQLSREPADVQARVRLHQGSMTCFDVDARFRLIYIPARSFQALRTRGEQRCCLTACRRHLLPGGLLAFDVFNPALWRLLKGTVEEEPAEYDVEGGGHVRELGHTDYDLATQTATWQATYECSRDGEAQVHEYTTPLHYFFRYECEWMLEACGFQVDRLWGDFDKSEFGAGSKELIVVARKPE